MTIFDQAKARADERAPPPVEQPRNAAAIAFGFGLFVIGLYLALQWIGLSSWIAWLASAAIYGGIAYADCHHGWARNRQEYREAMEELKERTGGQSVH
jgi:hypothetical protein